MMNLDEEFDAGLEDELNALLEGRPVPRSQAPVSRVAPIKNNPQRSNPKVASKNFDVSAIEKMTSGRGADIQDDDVNEEDLNDENLMAELRGIVGNDVETTSASQVYTVKIPQTEPEPLNPAPPRRPAPPPPSVIVETNIVPVPKIPEPDYPVDDMSRLCELRDGYRRAALNSKRSGSTSSALEMMKVAKQLEIMISAIEKHQPVDMSNLPPPAPQDQKDSAPTRMRQNPEEHTMLQPIDMGVELPQDISREEASRLFNAPESASSVLEALNQRLDKYKETASQAEAKGDSSKVRRLGRIIKQYEIAIKAQKSGKDFDYTSLPAPPGFPDIPLEEKGVPASNKPISRPMPAAITPAPATPPKLGPSTTEAAKGSPKAPSDPKPPLQRRQSSIHSKQLSYLIERQKLFKEAALEAKNRGDIQQALDYLKQAKGFEPLIEATKSGLPIDATSIPTPPQLADDFVMISKSDAEVTCDDLTKDELFRKVEMELNDQIEMCKRNKEHFTKLGDVSSASKFEKFQIDSMKDLDLLRCYWKNGDKLPRYRYETRTFSIVQSNPDLGTNEAVIIVLKAIDLPGKEDLDTYVRIEFPFPTGTPQVRKTRVVKDTIHPVFHEQFKFDMDRKSRSLARIFKRHPLKVDVFSKGGFMRSDTLIGTATIKLNELETKCTIHESYPLLDGRKTVGGRIEVKITIREPLLAKQVEEVKERWLVFE